MDQADGSVAAVGDDWRIRFERRLKHTVDAVWTAIIGPGRMSRWFDQTQMPDPLKVGAVIRFHHEAAAMDSAGRITALAAPRLIEWLWSGPLGPGNLIRWELQPEPDGCRLIMSLRLQDSTILARSMAGWHICLDRMEIMLDGGDEPGMPGWPTLFERYAAQVQAEGVKTAQLGAPPKPRTTP